MPEDSNTPYSLFENILELKGSGPVPSPFGANKMRKLTYSPKKGLFGVQFPNKADETDSLVTEWTKPIIRFSSYQEILSHLSKMEKSDVIYVATPKVIAQLEIGFERVFSQLTKKLVGQEMKALDSPLCLSDCGFGDGRL
ncbi:hypothetical protein BMS3Abin17_01043 [archaeon BMS3Abin17]|nr:hypothetical protein BMS3Abin17_01043 [archaeon BMS3Abin17]HDZ61490.1 hypothetical protein [Candidatus Pacearchaeota archaeon]